MNISVDIAELYHALDRIPADQNIMLSGGHGIGKSQILTQYFQEKGMKVVALFLGQMSDPGDLIGLPDKSGEKTVFRPPYWFPLDGKPVVLFLDELNRARPEVLQTIMDLALNRRLAGRDLPPGSRVIAAVNEGEEYQLTDLDPALVSRFNVFRFEPSVDEWLVWARKSGVDERVIDFITTNKDWLDHDPIRKSHEDTGLDKTPDRRGWKRVSDLLKGIDYIENADQKVIASIVGVRAMQKFMAEVRNAKRLTAEEFLKNYEENIQEVMTWSLHDQSVLNDGIFQYLEIDGAKAPTRVARNLSSYINYLISASRGEILASFASNITNGHFPHASRYIALNCPDVVPILMRHISSYRK
ncbi:MAG: AAA family ATPase [Bacteroidales bacterium]|nr:AAA family ATPase [Bacteroidales bacterium]